MKLSVTILLALALGLAGCGKPQPVVVLDGWWDVDFAKDSCRSAKTWMKENTSLIAQLGCNSVASCNEMTSRYQACLVDDSGGIGDFQTELATQFAADPACGGVKFVQFNSPSEKNKAASEALADKHWALTIDFIPGKARQGWSLVGPASQVLKGNNLSNEIAKKVCAIAIGRGAAVSN